MEPRRGCSAADAGVLLLLCVAAMGQRFSDAMNDSVPDEFIAVLTRKSAADRLLLDSVYSIPNMFMPLVGGLLMDKVFGPQRGLLLACCLIAIGSTLISAAASVLAWQGSDTAFVLTVIGWVFFSFGNVLYVGQQACAAERFKGRYFATVLSITNCFGQASMALNFATMPTFVQVLGFPPAMWIATGLCYVSVIAALVLFRIHLARTEYEVVQGEQGHGTNTSSSSSSSSNRLEMEEELSEGLISLARRQSEVDEAGVQKGCVYIAKTAKEVIFHSFGVKEWLLVVVCVSIYICVDRFVSLGSRLFEHVFHLSEKEASLYIAFPLAFEAVSLPFISYAVDSLGYPLRWLCLSTVAITLVHFMLLFPNPPSPRLLVLLFGIGRSLLSASLWPMVAYLFPPRLVATGYGLMISFQNIGLVLAPVIVGEMLPNYSGIELLLTTSGVVATTACISVSALDIAQSGKLQGRPSRPVSIPVTLA